MTNTLIPIYLECFITERYPIHKTKELEKYGNYSRYPGSHSDPGSNSDHLFLFFFQPHTGCQVIGQVKKNRKIGHCNPKNRIFLQKQGQK